MACDSFRFVSILDNKLPFVLSVGALDMVNFGAKATVPDEFQQRKIYEHNEQMFSKLGFKCSLLDRGVLLHEWVNLLFKFCKIKGQSRCIGALATALTNPSEVLKVRLKMNTNSNRGPVEELRRISSTKGITALWKGVGPAMIRAAALTASQLATYDESKRVLTRWTPLEECFYLHLVKGGFIQVFLHD